MKFSYLTTSLIAVVALASCKNSEPQSNGWRPLFDGESLNGWTAKINGYNTGDNAFDTFRVENGILRVSYDGYGPDFNNRFGHLFYEQSFSAFHLLVEYRFENHFVETAPHFTFLNSGVMFHSQAPSTILKDQNWPISVEIQFLGSAEGTAPRSTGNMCSPGTDIFIDGKIAEDHCVNSSSRGFALNEWVIAELIVDKQGHVTHSINGEIVLEYDTPQIGGGPIKGYDPAVKVDGTAITEGFIGLQSEGQEISFKRVWIKEL